MIVSLPASSTSSPAARGCFSYITQRGTERHWCPEGVLWVLGFGSKLSSWSASQFHAVFLTSPSGQPNSPRQRRAAFTSGTIGLCISSVVLSMTSFRVSLFGSRLGRLGFTTSALSLQLARSLRIIFNLSTVKNKQQISWGYIHIASSLAAMV